MQVLSSSLQLWSIGTQALVCPSPLLSPLKPFSCYLTLSSHPQVTSDLEPTLSIHLKSNRNHFPYPSHSPNIVHQPSMTWLIFVLITYFDQHQYSQANSLFLISFHFGLTLLTLTSISIFIFSSCSNQYLIKSNPLSISSCSCKASHYWDQSIFIKLCLICHLSNILDFTWFHDIPQDRSHFINSIWIVVFCLN